MAKKTEQKKDVAEGLCPFCNQFFTDGGCPSEEHAGACMRPKAK